MHLRYEQFLGPGEAATIRVSPIFQAPIVCDEHFHRSRGDTTGFPGHYAEDAGGVREFLVEVNKHAAWDTFLLNGKSIVGDVSAGDFRNGGCVEPGFGLSGPTKDEDIPDSSEEPGFWGIE